MGRPIFILAGQSNANSMKNAVFDALNARYGPSGFELIVVAESGAPLTFRRAKSDWKSPNELPLTLLDSVITVLDRFPGSHVEAMIWIQGEADTYKIARASNYQVELSELYSKFVSDLAANYPNRDVGANSVNFIVSGLSQNAPAAPERPNWFSVREQQYDFAARFSFATWIDPDMVAVRGGTANALMFKDPLHYADSFKVTLASVLVQEAILSGSSGLVTGNVDDDVLVGSGNTNFLHGLDGDDRLIGRGGDDILTGGEGNDVLKGGVGVDTMLGGMGDDRYVVINVDDKTTEQYNEGTDLIISHASITLGPNIENLRLHRNAGAINGTGNNMDNRVYGNDEGNTLTGAAGNDKLSAKSGNDWIIGGTGNDLLVGGTGKDTFQFNIGDGIDIVRDFQQGSDLLLIEGRQFEDLEFIASNRGVWVEYTDADRIHLIGVNADSISADDFIFL